MSMDFVEAEREHIRLRMAIAGPSGSGKTATGLLLATALARHLGKRVGVIDSEKGRALSYKGTKFAPDGFLHLPLKTTTVEAYLNALSKAASNPAIGVLVVDSLTHAWAGEGGLLEEADTYSGEDNWKKWGPIGKKQNKLLGAITSSPLHIIATMRSKTEWMPQTAVIDGRTKITGINRVGTVPVQRKGVEYEFGIFLTLDQYHNLSVIKSDCTEIDRVEVLCPNESFMEPIIEWLETGKVTQEIEVHSRLATLQQISEWYELLQKKGISEQQGIPAFVGKYGSKPEEMTEEFLESILVEWRQSVTGAKMAAPPPSYVSPRFARVTPPQQPTTTVEKTDVPGSRTGSGQGPAGNPPTTTGANEGGSV